MAEPQVLSFDDEAAGGSAHWHERVAPGSPLPAPGDTVVGPRGNGENGLRVYVVVSRDWTFVQPNSPRAQRGDWTPFVRIQVRPRMTGD